MTPFPHRPSAAELRVQIADMRQELAIVSQACLDATDQRRPGRVFFLLRKKWRLTQRLFEAEGELLRHTPDYSRGPSSQGAASDTMAVDRAHG